MRPLTNRAGTTLIELLLATVIITLVVISLSLILTHSSNNTLHGRQTWEATHLASSQIELVKSQPYAYVETQACDCTAPSVDYATLVTTTVLNAGTAFNVATCVNYVTPGPGNTWTAQCPAAGDTGYKIVLVHVFWKNGNQGSMIAQESSLTRF